ncbi:VanZ family protein [Planctomyces sp. SH-PL62]|uniref:VanZ family protein n=1 Tax=Planctomyces sp. SH-PL62 TaxID=1636152 RepID=UPI00078D8D4A|nr:VanZ family protein [Planctomyces sp. SH-PL62]AMV39565.1 VanZ like family protein [Planctomyces sp. SH-PL62]
MRHWLYAAIGWTLLIFVLCWMPRTIVDQAGGEGGFMIPNLDKVAHSGLFAGFAFLWLKAAPVRKRLALVVLAGLAIAVITELGQLMPVVNREADIDDGLFDLLGIALGSIAYFGVFGRERVEEAVVAQAKGA